ncbi:MAG: dihydroorotate dehydrogenase electron transfer subunit [bacterium]|nr:dihydroorotate dehydrogenase electron transfer subunit [bacterium]
MKPTIVKILNIEEEAENVLTFTLDYPALNSRPGQFVMLWLPGVDMKPFSIASDDGKELKLSIFKVKKFTTALFEAKIGDKVGVTGPFGNPYSWKQGAHVLAVGGGYGSAPLAYLINEAKKDDCTFDLFIGARRKNLLLYSNKFPEEFTHIATDDGSEGHTGYVTEILEEKIKKLSSKDKKRAVVYVCGPELMEVAAAKVSQKYNIPSQISVERFMKCGFGVCGQCCIDDTGEPMCIQGPVLSGEHALSLPEFGKYHRTKAGAVEKY